MMAQNGTPINPVPALKKGEPAPPIEGKMKAEFAQAIVAFQGKLSEAQARQRASNDASSPTQTVVHQ
jgi:hypothetical protein